MEKILKNEKGITLITLVVAVTIMIIISGLLIYNARTGLKVRNYNMMINDIKLLDDKVAAYYAKYGALPVEIKYNVRPLPFENIVNPNDSEDGYYVLDLNAFEGLTLNYGADYNKVTADTVADYNDYYVINEQSRQIYYAKGIEMDGEPYFTNDTSEEVESIKQRNYLVVGELYYDKLLNAIEAANDGATIKVINNNIEETDYLTINKNITLDLNGKTINFANNNITIDSNVIIDGNGTLNCTGSGASFIINNGSLEVKNATISSNRGSGTIGGTINNTGNLIINNSHIIEANGDTAIVRKCYYKWWSDRWYNKWRCCSK